MTRCSHCSGHDPAEDLPPELPALEEIGNDVHALQEFADMARARKTALEKKMKPYEKGVAAQFIEMAAGQK